MSKVKSKKRSALAKKKVLDCSSEEETSMDEDTQESNNETELENIWSRGGMKILPGMDKKPPIPRGAMRKMVPKKLGNVTGQKLDSKIDLPGRVSFSSNDLYEIDYSDYEDNDFTLTKPSPLGKIGQSNSKMIYDERKFQEPLTEQQIKPIFNLVKFEEQ